VVPVITFSPAGSHRRQVSEQPKMVRPVDGKYMTTRRRRRKAGVEGAVYRDALPCMKALRAAMRYAEF
jgi:hypothetical protein